MIEVSPLTLASQLENNALILKLMATSITPLAMNTTKLEGNIIKVSIVEQYKCINDNVVK